MQRAMLGTILVLIAQPAAAQREIVVTGASLPYSVRAS